MLSRFDQILLAPGPDVHLKGWKRVCVEFLFFGIKEARACLFAGLFFILLFVTPRAGLLGIARYDLLFIGALLIQVWMIATKLETRDELYAICLFHILGFTLEVFKTSSYIQSWHYPDPGYLKLFGVPLFSGFMYAAVGSYIIQAWRLFKLRITYHPRYWMAIGCALLIYLNFFTHHFIGDFRGYLLAFSLGLYARSTVHFTPYDKERQMPLLLSFLLIGFFIWIAENLGTFFGAWRYPDQLTGWVLVYLGKWNSWALLVMMTFTIVIHLKHIKSSISVPK